MFVYVCVCVFIPYERFFKFKKYAYILVENQRNVVDDGGGGKKKFYIIHNVVDGCGSVV